MAQELELLAAWSEVFDLSQLSYLADLVDNAAADLLVSDPTLSAQLTADADQLRAALDDFTVQIGYVNDLERLLGGDDNPFSGIEGDVSFAPALGPRETTHLVELELVFEIGTHPPGQTSQHSDVGMVLDPGAQAASTSYSASLGMILTPEADGVYTSSGPPPPPPPPVVSIRELLDIETLIVKHLQADQTLITAGVKQIAGPESPKQPKWPMVRIHRIGGVAPVAFWLDGALIQVDIWGTSDTAKLRAMTSKVWVSLQKLVGVHPLGVVTGVQEIVGRGYLPDPQTDRPRYLMTIRVFAHPNP